MAGRVVAENRGPAAGLISSGSCTCTGLLNPITIRDGRGGVSAFNCVPSKNSSLDRFVELWLARSFPSNWHRARIHFLLLRRNHFVVYLHGRREELCRWNCLIGMRLRGESVETAAADRWQLVRDPNG